MNTNHEDILLDAIVEGGRIESQWSQWTELAEEDPALWRRLAEAQRNQLALERTMSGAAQLAERAASTASMAGASRDGSGAGGDAALATHAKRGPATSRSAALRTWSGWAVAASLVIAGAILQLGGGDNAGVPPTDAQPVVQQPGEYDRSDSEMTPEQAFDRYLALGRKAGTVVEELPTRVLLDAQPSETGIGYDVTYLRQIKEQATVPDLYEVIGQDDQGRAQLASYEPRRGAGSM